MTDYCLSPLAHDDIHAISAIEQRAHCSPWSDTQLTAPTGRFDHAYGLRLMQPHSLLIGYFYARCVAGEGELLNIAIDPTYQGQGWGSLLLKAMIEHLHEAGAESIWLEVRESNIAAQALYQKHGFEPVNRRKHYYACADGRREDAWIMQKKLMEN
jgi:ribosomal-protein-alanine acetyltransferase